VTRGQGRGMSAINEGSHARWIKTIIERASQKINALKNIYLFI